jgi:hypothetical protein
MARYLVPAAIAALALCAPVASQAQTMGSTGPIPLQNYPQAGDVTAAVTTYSDDGFPGSGYYRGESLGPALAPAPARIAAPMASAPPPGMAWVPGHYNWDPARQTYAWIEGQSVQAPHLNAQWVAGHWMQTPSAWIWVNGSWN